MTSSTKRTLFWAPRVLTMLFAVFMAVLALDVFNQGFAPGETLGALLMELVPAGIVVAVLIVSWRRDWLGATLFSTLALLYVWQTIDRPVWITAIAGPMLVIGALYLVNALDAAAAHRHGLLPPGASRHLHA